MCQSFRNPHLDPHLLGVREATGTDRAIRPQVLVGTSNFCSIQETIREHLTACTIRLVAPRTGWVPIVEKYDSELSKIRSLNESPVVEQFAKIMRFNFDDDWVSHAIPA